MWGASSMLMALLWYSWHGIILNDIAFSPLSDSALFAIAAGLYFTLGGLQTVLFTGLLRKFRSLSATLIVGLSTGIITFTVVNLVMGLYGFTDQTIYFLMDTGWQLFEQTAGAFAVMLIFQYSHRRYYNPLQ